MAGADWLRFRGSRTRTVAAQLTTTSVAITSSEFPMFGAMSRVPALRPVSQVQQMLRLLAAGREGAERRWGGGGGQRRGCNRGREVTTARGAFAFT